MLFSALCLFVCVCALSPKIANQQAFLNVFVRYLGQVITVKRPSNYDNEFGNKIATMPAKSLGTLTSNSKVKTNHPPLPHGTMLVYYQTG